MLQITDQTLPLDVADLKEFLRIEHDDDNAQLLRCLKAGISFIEHTTERDIVERSWSQSFLCFDTKLTLDRSPMKTVDSFTYIDEDGTSQDFADYTMVAKSFARPVIEIDTEDFPTSATDLSITYTTGFDTLPPVIEQGILWAASHFYLQRETEVIGTITSPLKLGVQRIIDQIKAGGYA